MKRFILLLLVILLLPVWNANAQVAVFDAILDGLLTTSNLNQVIYYGKQLADNFKQLEYMGKQAEHMLRTMEMATDNLSRIGDVKSWDDFMEWHNRQLYLERMTEQTFAGMKITIGKKSYSLTDIEGMAHGVKESYVDYWDKEFTEEQRREMWVGLGMTPANYAYVQTWKDRERYLALKFLTSPTVQNNEYMRSMINNHKILERLLKDSSLPMEEKIGEKEIAAMQTEVLVDISRSLNDQNMMLADMLESKAVDKYLEQTPADTPVISSGWQENGFRRLK